MKQIKKLIIKMRVNPNSYHYSHAIVLFITMLTILTTVFFIVPSGVCAQTSVKVLVNADGDTVHNEDVSSFSIIRGMRAIVNDTVLQVSGKSALIQFKGVFHGLGGVSFPFGASEASAASADGSVVIGFSQSVDGIDEAFRWNAGALEPLGNLPGGNESVGLDISADGSVVVGYGTISNGLFEAFRWTEEGGMEGLGFLHSGDAWSEALGVSADGSVVVGDGSSKKGIAEAFRWEDGVMESLGDLPGGSFSSRAFDVSADGSVVVGESESEEGDEAFIWTEEEGMQSLLTGGRYDYTSARAISGDGSVVVGLTSTNNFSFTEAFLLNLNESDFEGLGDLPGGKHFSRAFDVSFDGSIVVGHSHTENGLEAFIWTNSHYNMRSLKDVLENVYGLDLTGWTLSAARGISVSGRGFITIVGTGTNPDGKLEGWRTVLPHFAGVGDLHANSFFSTATGLSRGGTVAVGTGISENGNEAFRWKNGVIEGLGDLPGGGFDSEAEAVSADGSVVVGTGSSGDGMEAFRWENGTMEGLGDLPGGSFLFSEARDVSADGAVVVGRGESNDGFEAFRWEDGIMKGLGDLAGGSFHSEANGVSADGSVVVGRSLTEDGFEAFRWTESSGMVGLGDLPGGNFSSTANAVSNDGSVVVGGSSSENGFEAFRWTEDGGIIGLGDLPGGDFSSTANAVSDDGSIVVGKSDTDGGFPFGFEAFIWTEENGMQNLKDLAKEEHGIILSDWAFAEATDVEIVGGDTVVVTGRGMNPLGLMEGFRIPLTGIGRAAEASSDAPVNVLSSPSPNPVRETSTFKITADQEQHVTVEVYDALGRRVQTLYKGTLSAGASEMLTFDASALPVGVYFIRARGKDFTKERRIVIIR